MKRYQSSLTAEGIAFARAIESSKPASERLCYDRYARGFVGPGLWYLGRALSGYAARRSPGVLEYLAARTRFIDDYLASCVADGIAQLVILGAGFDARAYRFQELLGRVKVFEVDHPATQRAKIEKLKQMLGVWPAHVTFVSIDFTTESLSRLLESGYDKQFKTLFIWEGVTMYIAGDAVDATLAFVVKNSGVGSSIVFDYVFREALDGTLRENEVKSMQRWRGLTGEGLVFGIRKGCVEKYLGARGFEHIVDMDGAALEKEYFSDRSQRPGLVARAYGIVHANVAVAS